MLEYNETFMLIFLNIATTECFRSKANMETKLISETSIMWVSLVSRKP